MGCPEYTIDDDRDLVVADALHETAADEHKSTVFPETKEEDHKLMVIMGEEGIINPYDALFACKWVGASLAVCCVCLDMESAGGHNIFGGDPGGNALPIQWRETPVTKAKYEVYSHNVDVLGERVNGVGSTQLTSRSLQKGADARGGCWVDEHNMAEGFLFMKQLIRAAGGNVQLGFQHYNGAGPAAENYGRNAFALYEVWAHRFS